MIKNEEIEVLMADGCSEAEAQFHIKRGAVVIEKDDFSANFGAYMQEWGVDEKDQESYRRMLEENKPFVCTDVEWGVVEKDGKVYFIMYVL